MPLWLAVRARRRIPAAPAPRQSHPLARRAWVALLPGLCCAVWMSTATATPDAPTLAPPRPAATTPTLAAATTPTLDAAAPAPPRPAATTPTPDDFAPFPDATLETRYRGLIAKLRCLVCQNESLADSHAPLAADLRREVRGMLEAGQADPAILAFLTDRYGDFVLYDPPLDVRTALLWVGPPLLLVLGAGWLAMSLAGQRRALAPPAPLDADTRTAVNRALDEET